MRSPPPSRARRVLFRLLAVMLGLGVAALLLEGVLRLLPVNEGLRACPVHAGDPILHFEPDRTSLWSRGWDFASRNVVRTNNYGFVSHLDYSPAPPDDVIAVVGDSYIEAAMLPWEETAAGVLHHACRGRAVVYSFAVSGAPLSQYLAYARFARDEFHPRRLIVSIVSNDYDESLLAYKRSPGMHHFEDDGEGGLRLVRVDYEVGPTRRLMRRSKLALYLVSNLGIRELAARLRANGGAKEAPAPPEVWVRDSKRAVDTFLDLLPGRAGLAPDRILLVVDGLRPGLYEEETFAACQGSYPDLMRRYLLDEAARAGLRTLDLQPAQRAHHAETGQRLELGEDPHWNAAGHALFAREVLRSGFLEGLGPEDPP